MSHKIDLTAETNAQDLIREECRLLESMLLEKNRQYGNSALDPLRVFSKSSPDEQIRTRLDDKLSRLARGAAAGEDVELDLMGYLVLLRVHRKLQQRGLDADAVAVKVGGGA